MLFSSCAGGGKVAAEPPWVRDPYAVYSRQANVAAVGFGSSREIAEKSALGRLVAFFGQSIQVDEKLTTSYLEAVRNGVMANWSDTTARDSGIITSAGMDTLVGAEIGDVWHNDKNEYYAVAVLNRANTVRLYSEMIRANQAVIENLVNIPEAEKNTLEGFARYYFAAVIADVIVSYGNLLSVIGMYADGSPAPAMKKGDDYRLLALDITRTIPVGISVQNDRAGRIAGAFAGVFSGAGFMSGGDDPRYVLDAAVTLEPVDLAGNQNKFSRITLKANLVDTRLNVVLLPFDFNSREGHVTQAEADNRAYSAAERRINEEYAKLLTDYLARLLPGSAAQAR
ncbi:MAG: LPP20 family lipoprotein [Treponema sp.]|nr:LPP20 family lipoprotein [Treponema sp.]